MSRAAALRVQLSDVLDVVAAEACEVTRARAVSILLASPGGGFRLVASRGLSDDYNRFLKSHFISHGPSPSRAATDRLEPVVIDDIRSDPRLRRREAREWRSFAMREQYRSLLSVPMAVGSRESGAINLYRTETGPWLRSEIELAATVSQHAASAIDSAGLIDSQRRQLESLEHLVRVLSDQTHEHANRLHAISGLFALGEMREAQAFLAQLVTLHHQDYAAVIERIHEPVLAGVLLAQMNVARQRGVQVRLHRRTRLESLPPSLGGAEAMTIVAYLIESAVDAVAGLSERRRRVTVRLLQSRKQLSIVVRDWRRASPDGQKRLTGARSPEQGDDAELGLTLVSDAVSAAHGAIEIRDLEHGRAVLVWLPVQ